MSHEKVYEIKAYERLNLPPYCLLYAGRDVGESSSQGCNESVGAATMILARADKLIGPFANADAAWKYVGDKEGLFKSWG